MVTRREKFTGLSRLCEIWGNFHRVAAFFERHAHRNQTLFNCYTRKCEITLQRFLFIYKNTLQYYII